MRKITRVLSFCCLIVAFSIGFTPTWAGDVTVSTCDFATLSAAVTTANDGGGVINFACSGTIFFDTELVISANVTINGGGAITFDGRRATRLFAVNRGASLTLDGLTLQNGRSGDGGAIANNGTLTISNSIFNDNTATKLGGAIYSAGTLTINTSTFTSNSAGGFGGAFYGNATINNSSFINNSASEGGAFASNSGVSSQDSYYENNTCAGTVIDGGRNRLTPASSVGCPGTEFPILTLSAPTCNPNTNSMEFDILIGDGTTFAVTGTGPDIPSTMSIGRNTLPAQTSGTNRWELTITEMSGDEESMQITIMCNVPIAGDNATVTDCDNFTGLGTIDEAVLIVNSGGGIIDFACSGTIFFDKELVITADVTINANGNTVIFDEAGDDNRFFTVTFASLTLNGLTLQNGNADIGGAIYSHNSRLIITDSAFFRNRSRTTAGAIFTDGDTLTITNSDFIGNQVLSTSGAGGAIYSHNNRLIITDSAFKSNSATDGGAIRNNSWISIDNSIFIANGARNGGAIFNTSILNTMNISNTAFTDNYATQGGAIFSFQARIFLSNSAFISNDAALYGGAIFGAIVNINNTTFMVNGAPSGGGAFLAFNASSQDSQYISNTCAGTVTDNGGNKAVSSPNCPNSPLIALTVSTPTCNPSTNSMEFDILTGNGTTFAVTGTGPDVPSTMSIGTNTLPAQTAGPNTWNLTITETVGYSQIRQSRVVSITCAVPVDATAVCDGDNLLVEILAGDPTFNIVDARGVLLGDVGLGVHTIVGPISTRNLRVRERGGSLQTVNLADVTCGSEVEAPPPDKAIIASATCIGLDLQVSIGDGDAPFTINYGLGSTTDNPTGVYTFAGPAIFNNVTVTEEAGDFQSASLGNFNCNLPLSASATCVGVDLQVNITGGDAPFTINYGLGSTSNNALGTYTFAGPASFNGVTVTEQGGDTQTLSLGNFNCYRPLSATATCVGDDLQVTISGGDATFGIDYSLGSTTGNGLGVYTFPGPANFFTVTVMEESGDFQSLPLGNFNCTRPLSASATCVGVDLQVTISNGDANFGIIHSLGSMNNVSLGVYTFTGPGAFNNVMVNEEDGNFEVLSLGNFSCFRPLVASAGCVGNNLQITITDGDPQFSIQYGASSMIVATTGVYSIAGPGTFTGVGVFEFGGDNQGAGFGNLTCP